MDSVVDIGTLEFNKYIGVLSDYLTRLYIKLGRPEADTNNENFWVMIDELVNNWSVIYKDESKDFVSDIRLERAVERSISASVKGGFKKSVMYPPHFYQMVKIFFPTLKLQDRKFIEKFISRYPIFNASNYT